MINLVILDVNRDSYGKRETASESMTVEELIERLKRYDPESKVIFANDGGYTYGYLCDGRISEDSVESIEEEEKRLELEELDDEIDDTVSEIKDYENFVATDEDDEEREQDKAELERLRAHLATLKAKRLKMVS